MIKIGGEAFPEKGELQKKQGSYLDFGVHFIYKNQQEQCQGLTIFFFADQCNTSIEIRKIEKLLF